MVEYWGSPANYILVYSRNITQYDQLSNEFDYHSKNASYSFEFVYRAIKT